ncbi:putative transposable element [Trichonephila clavipes]|nr:putative transposable element [Trichonephila clavipes]
MESFAYVITVALTAAAVDEWSRYRMVAGLVTSSSPVPLKTRRKSLAIRLTFAERSFLTLADGAKYSLFCREQITRFLNFYTLADGAHKIFITFSRYLHCAHGWSSQIPTALVESRPPFNKRNMPGKFQVSVSNSSKDLVFGLAIHQNDHQARRRFVEWAQNKIAVVPDFHKRILFSDEAHFWLNSYVNKQNCRIWSEANPQVYVETPLHPEKLTVWCLYGLVESFFKNDAGHNVTVNGDRYRAMITNFFIPELNNHDDQELWFQQDGATCHTARTTIDLLKDTFGDRLIISRFGPVNWPPRSCDLTPLDYFLWGYVKSLVYADKPQTLDHLEGNIRRVIADIRPQMLEKVIEN